MIGRGTSDDKGPGVAAVFAMKAILNAGIPLRRRCRLILGCDEECGMQDLEYYEQKIGGRIGASLRTRISRLSTPKRAASSWRCTRRSTTRG